MIRVLGRIELRFIMIVLVFVILLPLITSSSALLGPLIEICFETLFISVPTLVLTIWWLMIVLFFELFFGLFIGLRAVMAPHIVIVIPAI